MDTPSFALNDTGQIALTISDLDRSVTFYRETLGLKHLFTAPPGLAFFAAGNVRLMLARPENPQPERFTSAVYFKVADIDQAAESLIARGVKLAANPHLVAKMPDHDLCMTFLRDPDGHLLGLMCEKRS